MARIPIFATNTLCHFHTQRYVFCFVLTLGHIYHGVLIQIADIWRDFSKHMRYCVWAMQGLFSMGPDADTECSYGAPSCLSLSRISRAANHSWRKSSDHVSVSIASDVVTAKRPQLFKRRYFQIKLDTYSSSRLWLWAPYGSCAGPSTS